MATGNGAFVVHKTLAETIPEYDLLSYSPLLTFFPPLLYLFKDKKCDLLHVSPDYAPFFYSKKIPMVVTFHGYNLDDELKSYNSFLQNLHYKTDLKWFTSKAIELATKVTCVSKYLANKVQEELHGNDVRVIYNGVNEELFRPDAHSRRASFDVVFSGNFTTKKGAYLLSNIAERLNPGIRILYTSGLRGRQANLDDSRLLAIGRVPHEQMPMVYQNADALIFPSVREGFGLAIAEAMACGLPIVASNNSAIPELVIDKKGGLLCEAHDADAFALAINTLADSTVLCREMGEFNRSKVESEFTLDRMVSSYSELFEEVLSG